MKFIKLAELLHNLENTSKRLEMTDILSNFFKNIKESQNFEDLDKIMHLLQGQLASNIKQDFPKMGIAEKMIIEALSLHSGINKEEVKEVLVKKGDIGSAAEIILKTKKKQKSLLDFNASTEGNYTSIQILELYSELEKIARTEGSGSHDIKLGILRGLICIINPLETKYLLRIITSTLRVGVSTQTIIDGLALGFTGEKNQHRDIIEHAYNLHPDLGEVAKMLAEKGMEGVKDVEISHGIPIRMMLASRVPYTEILIRLGIPCTAEYKLDGERLQIHKKGTEVLLFSRRLLEISEQYPDVCQVIRDNIHAETIIMEGEVVAMDHFYERMLPFQVLSKRRRKYDIKEISKEVPVCLYLFDVLLLENEEYIEKTLPERRKALVKVIEERDELKLVKSKQIHNTEELLEFFQHARQEGTEGIIAKSINEKSIYKAGNRGFLWIKLKGLEGGKLKDSVDVVLVGAFYGRGRRGGVFGTYIGAVYDEERDSFIAFTRISSGWTDKIMEELMERVKYLNLSTKPHNVICEDTPDIWLKPEITIEIIGDEITKSEKFSTLGYSMRFPVFQRFRTDKGIRDITKVEEIEQLYNTQ